MRESSASSLDRRPGGRRPPSPAARRAPSPASDTIGRRRRPVARDGRRQGEGLGRGERARSGPTPRSGARRGASKRGASAFTAGLAEAGRGHPLARGGVDADRRWTRGPAPPRRSWVPSSPASPAPTRAPASTGTKDPDRVWRVVEADRAATSETVWTRARGGQVLERGGIGQPASPAPRRRSDGTEQSVERGRRRRGSGAGTRPSRPAVGGASPSGHHEREPQRLAGGGGVVVDEVGDELRAGRLGPSPIPRPTSR